MNEGTLTYFPVQKLAFKDKDDEWKKACIEGTISTCYTYGRTRRSSPRDKARNYNLFNNKINKADFDYVLNPYKLSASQLKDFSFPASLQPYDVVSPYFNLLLGEESKRPFNPIIRAVNSDALNEKQKRKQGMILEELARELSEVLQDPDKAQQDVTKYQYYSPKLMIENTAEKFLNHYYKKESLDVIFNECFKDALIASEEIVDVQKVGDGVRVRRVNPLEIFFALTNNEIYLDEVEKIYERNLMTISEIVDEFYDVLTDDQLKELEQYGYGSVGMFNLVDRPISIPEVDNIFAFEDYAYNRGIAVHRVRWKSKKKLGIWKFIDEQGNPQEVIVEEDFKSNSQDPLQSIEWFWINEYWEGVRIGQDMYLMDTIKPRKQQFRDIDNISTCKSGYIGTVYSVNNSQSTSLMDRLVPWVYLYLIVWYRTELAMAKNIGKLGLIDISLIPDGWEPEKFMWYAQAMGFGFVNSFNESNKTFGIQGGNPSTNNKQLDLENGQYIKNHLEILNFIEGRIQMTAGITPQRLGSIAASELVGNTERAVMQSSYITEPYYAVHENFKVRVCEAVIEVAKECFEGKTKNFEYITDDMSTVLFQIDGAQFSNASYGVFCTNGSKDQKVLQTLENLLDRAFQSDKATLSTVVDVIGSNSIADVSAKLRQSEAESIQRAQQAAEAEQAHEAQLTEQKLMVDRERMMFEAEQNQLDRENQIEIAALKAQGSDAMGNPEDQQKVLAEQAKLALERSKLAHQRNIENRKLDLEAKKIEVESKRSLAELEKQHKHEKELLDKESKEKKTLERIKGANKLREVKAKPRPKPAAKKK